MFEHMSQYRVIVETLHYQHASIRAYRRWFVCFFWFHPRAAFYTGGIKWRYFWLRSDNKE